MKSGKSLYIGLLLAVVIALFVYKFTWYGMPDKLDSGRIDSKAFSFFLASILSLTSYLNKKIALLFSVAVLSAIALLIVGNWFHVQFYQDIIVPSSFLYGLDALDSASSISSLGPSFEAAGGVVVILFLTVACVLSWPNTKSNTTPAVFALVFACTGAFYANKFNTDFDNPLAVRGMHPIMGFLRAGLSINQSIPQDKHREAIAYFKGDDFNLNGRPDYPLYKEDVKSSMSTDKKNIIIVVMESMRSSETGFIGGRVGLTPNLDKIAEEVSVVKDFYANTTQTVRAEMAILCGQLDYNRGAPFSEYSMKLKNLCLPKILSSYGYQTHWVHGYDKDFFNRDSFLPQVGFEYIHDKSIVEKELDNPSVLGWGVPDVDVLDYAVEKGLQIKEPFFMEVLTLSNHYPFKWDWSSSKVDFSMINNDSALSEYHKGIHYTDHAIGVFWNKFKSSVLYDDTIVVFLGDHGVWLFDQEQDIKGEFYKNEAYHRVPFLIYNPTSKNNYDHVTASQIDVAPTILGMLGVSEKTAFLGSDFNAKSDSESYAILAKIGSSGYRKGDIACYATMKSCESISRKCNMKESDEKICAVANPRLPEYGYEVLSRDALEIGMNYAELVTEYSNIAYGFGFVPPEKLAQ